MEETLEALFLYGHYEVSADAKNRMLIPADVRRRINPETHGKDYFLTVGVNGVPWLYPDKYYEYLATQVKPDIVPGMEATEFDRMNFGLAQLVELDAQGRILIPVRSLTWTGLEQKKKFYLVGVRDHLELWDVAEWENERKALLARNAEIVARARQARQAP